MKFSLTDRDIWTRNHLVMRSNVRAGESACWGDNYHEVAECCRNNDDTETNVKEIDDSQGNVSIYYCADIGTWDLD